MKVRVLVADDEPLARKRLRALIAEVDWLDCVGEAENGIAAVRAIEDVQPDLVFLDIQMPGLNGLQVLERVTHRPTIIFTTAHNDYAVQAFECQALDYLLKPFGRERFRKAVERVRDLSPDSNDTVLKRVRDATRDTGHLTRLLVRHGSSILPVAVNEIEHIEADDDYVTVVVGKRRHLLYLTMTELLRRLDPGTFVRVHRSHIVNLDFVTRIAPHGDSRLRIELRDGTSILASRSGSQRLRTLFV